MTSKARNEKFSAFRRPIDVHDQPPAGNRKSKIRPHLLHFELLATIYIIYFADGGWEWEVVNPVQSPVRRAVLFIIEMLNMAFLQAHPVRECVGKVAAHSH